MKKLFLFVLLFYYSVLFSQPPFKTGINFPFRSPETASIQDFLLRLSELGVPAIRQMTYADVYWQNIEPVDNDWRFTNPDSAYFNPYGITPIGELFSIMGQLDSIGIQPPWEACDIPSFCYWSLQDDSVETKDYVQTVVNRYANVTSFWEIANEFESVTKPKGLASPSGEATQEQVLFLKSVYRWIKEVQPNATVLNPGLLGTYGYPFEKSVHWLDTIFYMGGGNAFDVVNYHDYNSWWTLPAHYDSIKSVIEKYNLQKPIWITECSISSFNISPITPDYSSEDQQAADVWRRICLLWAKGAQVVLWHSFWSSGDLTGWGEFGLLNKNGEKKKSYHAYKLLLNKVAQLDSVKLIQTGLITNDNQYGGDGIWVILFWKNGKPSWLIWSPDSQVFTLNNIPTNQIIITKVVPTQLLNNGDSAVFQIDTALVSNQSFTFQNLSNIPILVEPISVSNIHSNLSHKMYTISPNPTNENIAISFLKPAKNITLYTIDGKVIYEASVSDRKVLLSLLPLNKGVYLIQITFEDGTILLEKIVKI